MWRLKQFMQKEQSGLGGRIIDIGNLKVHIRNAIAEGGFSSVYLAQDAMNGSKQYALKHMICNDEESLELVNKEISVMKLLRGHPNVVMLYAHTILDMGRTKEALLVMEYCDKYLVTVLENRGAGYFEENQILAIFRDACNAVFAMHNLSPPIAHRDLKAENLLLGSDGLWKLCDFGSTSTNHKRFTKPEEMGIEEDNIRKHTTPAYRAPEMWDLYRREVINEKVDIWALGCLLFRMCYLKSAFDGESKLQILNGNFRIPELPKYSSSITDLIRDMLQSSPDTRPDITQIWFRVNGLLPEGLQKSLPDRSPEPHQEGTDLHEAGVLKVASKARPMPRRSPPSPPASIAEQIRNISPSHNSRAGAGGTPLGAFWSSQHAKDSSAEEEITMPRYDDEPGSQSSRNDTSLPGRLLHTSKTNSSKEENIHPTSAQKNVHGKLVNRPEGVLSKDFEINFFQDNSEHGNGDKSTFPNNAFNAFVADFDANKQSPSNGKKSEGEVLLEAELEKLREQLKQANAENAEISSKYEKLSAICRSQRQEIQELKQAVASKTPSRDASKNLLQPTTPQLSKKIEGASWELQQGFFDKNTPDLDPKPWQAFSDDPQPRTTPTSNPSKSVRTRNGHSNKQGTEAASGASTWGFGSESFTASPSATSHMAVPTNEFSSSLSLGDSKNMESKSASQPAGWAGF